MSVPIGELTDKQALVAILRELKEMRKQMTDLNQAVADLQVAVQGVLDRVGPTVDALKADVIAGQAALAAFTEADALEDANYEQVAADLAAALQASVDASQAAADSIEVQVTALNTVVPAPVVEPTPEVVPDPEPVVDPAPVDEVAPVVEG